MVGFVLTGHGTFADGLAGAVEMVAGPQQDFAVVPFLESEAGEYAGKVSGAIAAMGETADGVLVFCDLLGGTPFNQSMLAAQITADVEVVTGANLPMLLECLSSRGDGTSLDELVSVALEVGRQGIVHRQVVVAARDDESEEDGI